jgi:hypothetical protein
VLKRTDDHDRCANDNDGRDGTNATTAEIATTETKQRNRIIIQSIYTTATHCKIMVFPWISTYGS